MKVFASALNSLIAPFCILLLMLGDYWRDRNTDPAQRRIFTSTVSVALLGIVSNFAWDMLELRRGYLVNILLYITVLLYYLCSVATIAKSFVLLDYCIHKSTQRTRRINFGVNIFILAHLLILVGNLFFHYYYKISPTNTYVAGGAFGLHIVLIFVPIICAAADVFVALSYSPSYIINHLIVFAVPTVIGVLLDAYLGTHVLWSFLALSLLFAYLFILRQDADRDPLTKLNNRRSLDEYLEEMEHDAKRDHYSFIMMDLNKFKEINDKFGHFEGDKVLQDFSDIIGLSVRHIDFAARFGGDEFCIIAKGLNNPQRLVERVQENLNLYNRRSKMGYTVSFSHGCDLYTPEDIRAPRDFLSHVDELLYANKLAPHL